MLSVSQKQAGQRWDIITPALREALFSDVNADFVWNLCQKEHLTEEMSYDVAEISGYVLLGFLHPADLAGELVSAIDLPAPLAKTISDQINARVFAPLQADIDKVYSPLSKLGSALGAMPAPKIIQGAPASIPTPIPTPAPKPTTLSDIGWSKQPTMAPTANSGSAVSKPVAVPMPTPVAPIPPTPVPAPRPAAEPAPIMLHEDTAFKPAEKNAGFTLSKPEGAAEMSLDRGGAPKQAPIRPAVLEFGGAKPIAKPAGPAGVPIAESSIPKPPMPPLGAISPAKSEGRTVSQIGSSPIPKPPAAPKPPMPPMPSKPSMPPSPPRPAPTMQAIPKPPSPPQPPTPPAPPQNPQNPSKTIVKDFL